MDDASVGYRNDLFFIKVALGESVSKQNLPIEDFGNLDLLMYTRVYNEVGRFFFLRPGVNEVVCSSCKS